MKTPRLLSALLGMALLLGILSCSSDSPLPTSTSVQSSVAPQGDLLSTTDRLLGTLLSCEPLPYAITQQVVGPQGGVLRVGPHSLVIPSGALSQPVLITAEAPSDWVNSVRLFPEGLQFASNRAAVLTLSYRNCSLVSRLLPKRIAYTTDLLKILSMLVSIDNPLAQQVSAPLQHFSRYAVAW